MKRINPYYFVPLGKTGPKRIPWDDVSKHYRLDEDMYSGRLHLVLHTISPVFIPSYLEEDIIEEPVQTRRGEGYKRTYKRFHHRDGKPTIPASSIKGMIRSVFETLTNSCMALFAVTYGKRHSRIYPAPNFRHEDCNLENGLCPACSVFGTILGDELHLQGKVRFGEAVGSGSEIEKGEWTLKELSGPKPERHAPFYARDGRNESSGPKGRKFYYHHNPQQVVQQSYTTTSVHSHRNRKILERLKRGAQLSGIVDFQNLTREQVAHLLYAIELEYAMEEKEGKKRFAFSSGHKIGMGKPLGLGSLVVVISKGTITKGASRYLSFEQEKAKDLREEIEAFRKEVTPPSPGFRDLFSFLKYRQGTIGYPENSWFDTPANRGRPLGDLGVFDDER